MEQSTQNGSHAREELLDLEINYQDTSKLIPYINNARTHNEKQVAQIAASIKEFGWTNPILVDQGKGIIAGHGRLLAAEQLGITRVPTIELSGLSEAQKKAYVLADNRLAQNAGWDEDLLKIELQDLGDMNFDLSLLGFESKELNQLMEPEPIDGLTDPDEVPEVTENTTLPGDIWILGNHRLLCGSATDSKGLAKLMLETKATLSFTDPPYGVQYTGNAGDNAKVWDMIENDDLTGENLYQLLLPSFKNIAANTIDNPAVYVWHSHSQQMVFERALEDAGLEVKQVIIWNKGMVLSRHDYHWTHEPCFYARKNNQNNEWFGDRKHKTILRQENIDFTKYKKDELIQMLEAIKDDGTVWEIKRDAGVFYLHPTQKPTDLAIKAMINNSQVDDIVLDLFLGSGSTLIAAEQIQRRCYGTELDPQYCDVIVKRWEEFTGKEATLEKTGKTYNETRNDRNGTSNT